MPLIEQITLTVLNLMVALVMLTTISETLEFRRLSKENTVMEKLKGVALLHFQDHAIAVFLSYLGSWVGLIASLYSIVAINIFGSSDLFNQYAGMCIAITLASISRWLFLRHMIAEETPGHPFYIMEHREK